MPDISRPRHIECILINMQCRRVCSWVAAIGLCAASAPAISAQGIRGAVVDASGAPVPGVIVLLLDTRDSVESRALTNERGEYRVVAGRPGAYRLRSLRIGFRPTTSALINLAVGQEAMQQIPLTGIAIALDTIRVAGRNACRTRYDSAAATFAIWEQVRTALTATQLTRGIRGVEATLMMYERSMEPDRERVIAQQSSITSGLTRALWKSPTADSLRRGGYIVSNPDGSTTYWAPELAVLLSNAFVEDHCFRLASSRDTTRIGISFEPNRDRRGIAGIRGTLWLDRKSAELRQMEFRYVNATREQMYGSAGGQMEFRRTKYGAWIISSWGIRMPLLERRQSPAVGPGMRPSAPVSEVHVAELKVAGGEVSLITRGLDTLYARPPLPLRGIVADSVSGLVIGGATVVLRGTGMSATTDFSGRFRIPDLLPGNYVLDVSTKALSGFGFKKVVPIIFTDSAAVHTVALPAVDQIASSTCPAKHVGAAAQARDGIVGGTVRRVGDTIPPQKVRVIGRWAERTSTGARWGVVEALTDSRGAFGLCGLPIGAEITVAAIGDDTAGSHAMRPVVQTIPGLVLPTTGTPTSIPRGAPPAIVAVSTSGRKFVAASPVGVRLNAGSRFATVELVLDPSLERGAVFSGVVLSDLNGQPIPNVEISVDGQSRQVWSDEHGVFRVDDVNPGTRVVAARRVGFAIKSESISFAPNEIVDRTIVLNRLAVLDTVITRSTGLSDFDERRKLGLGKFLTRSDIDKLQGRPIGATLSQLGGAGVSFGRRNQAWILSSRPRLTDDNFWCPPDPKDRWEVGEDVRCGCYAQVYLDRTLMNPPITHRRTIGGRTVITRPTPPFDVNSIPSHMMEAIEWYSGPAQTPHEFSSPGFACGVLVIHTRRNF